MNVSTLAIAVLVLCTTAATAEDDVPTKEQGHALVEQIRNGMPVEEVARLLGGKPDEDRQSGACGVLSVARWERIGVQVISVDGRVSSFSRLPHSELGASSQ